MRTRPRTDANHAEIVKAFEDMKCPVQSLAYIGGGCPDLLVLIAGRNYLVEVKSPKGKLTPFQETWIGNWVGGDVAIIRSVDEAIDLVTTCRRR